MGVIVERTGFPRETLNRDLRLLDDLNMDSIKAGDIIATAARKLGALGPIDPASLADASIGDVVEAVRAAKDPDATASAPEASSTSMPVPVSTEPSSLPALPLATIVKTMSEAIPVEIAPQDDQTWTANFDIELVTHRPNATQQDISGRHFRVLHETGR